MDAHLTPTELAEREKVPIETIYSWNRTKSGPRYFRAGRHVRYPMEEVLAWETSRLQPAGPSA